MMYMVFELKARHELTWEDFPYIENPFFSHYRAMTALSEGHDFFGRRVHNIEQFKRRYVPYYDHSFNHQIVSDELRRQFFSGQFFSVARDKIPFSPSFKWRALSDHPDGGEWYATHPIYGDTLKQQLEDLAKRLSAQKRRWAAEEAEDNASAAALIPVVKRVIEKRENVDATPVEEVAPFKRIHKDGHTKDPYTLQADGKPLGAQEGIMPKGYKGLRQLPESHDLLVEQGFPHLNIKRPSGEFNMDYVNFSNARPDVLPPGTTLYRILDEKANPAGAYWATALPESKSTWRGNYAVKDSWNDNGYYTEYKVPPGDGLKVWRGTTAGQEYRELNGKEFFLAGGKEQIFVSPNTIAPAQKKLTNWTDASV